MIARVGGGLILLAVLELVVLVALGHLIGFWPTVGLIVLETVLGAMLVRRAGRRAWRGVRGGVAAGQVPGRELADGAVVLVAGVLLLTPGLVTDLFGALLLLPVVRPFARRYAVAWLARRGAQMSGGAAGRPAPFPRGPGRVGPGAVGGSHASDPEVIQGEVVDPDEGRP